MKRSKHPRFHNERVAQATALDMTPKEFSKLQDGSEVRPIRRGLYGEFLYWAGMTLSRMLLKIEIRGTENLPGDDEAYLLCPNHETYIDGMWVGGFLPRSHRKRYACLAAEDLLTDHGAFGRLIIRVGRGIPLNRKGNPLNGMKMAIKQVKEGNILMVHPEGTRTRTGRLGKLQEGAAFISRHSEAPIIPVFIDGGYEIFSRHRKWPSFWDKKKRRRRRLILTYGKPLDPANFKNTKGLTAALEAWMTEHFARKEVPRVY